MSHKVLFHAALIVLAFAVLLTGCRRSTPIIEPPPPEPPVPVEPEPPEDPDTAPTFPYEVDTLTYSVGVPIAPFLLPEAEGGNGELTYTLGPELPPGLVYVGEFGALVGTPLAEGDYPMLYVAEDADDNRDPSDAAVLEFVISVGAGIPVGEVLAAVRVGDAEGVLRVGPAPAAGEGPKLQVAGNNFVVSGGALFVDLLPDAPLDKLLLSIDMQSYYEIDLGAVSALPPYRLVAQVPPALDQDFSALCLSITGIGADGAAGEPACHPLVVEPVGTGDLEITLSWDTPADLDLHVVDPNGDEIYFLQEMVDSGGELDLESGGRCSPYDTMNEHVAWTGGTPPPGVYLIRVHYWSDCGAPETNYVVNVSLNGVTRTIHGMLEGPGEERGGRGSGDIVDTFTLPGAAPPPVAQPVTADYRGSGDQVFVINPEGEILDDTLVTLNLGSATAEVYVIATNTAHYPMEPRVERLDLLEAAAKGSRTAYHQEYHPQPRPDPSEPAPERPEVSDFNNNFPVSGGGGIGKGGGRLLQQTAPPVAEGDTHTFLDFDGGTVEIPATARRVITDGAVTVALWVADADWETACGPGIDIGGGTQPRAAHIVEKACVTAEMANALAARFLQPGAGNDIYDWVTGIFGAPWGAHDKAAQIPPEAANEIHILLFDIEGDGVPSPGESRIVGFFFSKDNYRFNPNHPILATSNERLLFYLDAPWFTVADGPTWEISDRRPSIMVGTLAHEFQHMIHYYQKRVLRDASSETWLNEMASEVAEDLIADKMRGDGPRSVDYDDPTAGEPENRRGRLPGFNLYNDLQVTRWGGLLANYSINYALGAYLARNYGGAALFSAIVQSGLSGTGAIEGALNDLGHELAFGDALANWGVATLLSDDTAAPVPHRYNPGTWSISRTGGVEYRLGSINLFNYAYVPRGPDGLISRLALEGPYLYSLETLSDTTLEPHSNRYASLGRNSGTIRLNVSAVTDNRITVVVKE